MKNSFLIKNGLTTCVLLGIDILNKVTKLDLNTTSASVGENSSSRACSFQIASEQCRGII